MKRSTVFLSLAGLLVSACGGTTPAPATPESSASSEPSTSEAAAPAAWKDDLSMGEKAAFMEALVVGDMGDLFKSVDATRYADFGCATCHGPEGKAPQEFLPKLVFKNNTLTAFAEKPEVSKFMAEQVSPKMASILGEKPFDPVTHEGFGCMGCHAIDAGK